METSIQMVTVALFIITQIPTNRWMDKEDVICPYTEYYSAIKNEILTRARTQINLENIMLNLKNPDLTGHILCDSCLWITIDKSTETEAGSACARGWVEEVTGHGCREARGFLLGRWKVPGWDSGGGYTPAQIYFTPLTAVGNLRSTNGQQIFMASFMGNTQLSTSKLACCRFIGFQVPPAAALAAPDQVILWASYGPWARSSPPL